LVGTIVEDTIEVRSDQESLYDAGARHRVLDVISDKRATGYALERVSMDPTPVRTSALLVDESMWRLPACDL
jgi:hypothetical protein